MDPSESRRPFTGAPAVLVLVVGACSTEQATEDDCGRAAEHIAQNEQRIFESKQDFKVGDTRDGITKVGLSAGESAIFQGQRDVLAAACKTWSRKQAACVEQSAEGMEAALAACTTAK